MRELHALVRVTLDQFKQSWYAQIINSNRLVTYSNVKFDFGLELYLQVLL